ncbi:hypothetical protein OIU78_006016 [Salix suchowensis]|nr:hypothetical protein OIU78_006016 [Salix suchowensis]
MADTKTVHSPLVTYASVLSLLTLCPPFVTLLWYTMAHVDGSRKPTCLQGEWHGSVHSDFGYLSQPLVYEQSGKVADSMLVNTILMLVYVTKFFWWEAGYWNTMDIAHDRAGFYICWGCLVVWVPSVYTSPGMYLVNHPVNLGLQLALYILAAGVLSIYVNYDRDRQRQEFRRTNGRCLVWGKAPSKIVASYTTASGESKTSLLLTSGWWGLSRHFYYVPEILAALFWTVPALFNHFLPYFYVIFLTILLFDRAKRDDDRCGSKKTFEIVVGVDFQVIVISNTI